MYKTLQPEAGLLYMSRQMDNSNKTVLPDPVGEEITTLSSLINEPTSSFVSMANHRLEDVLQGRRLYSIEMRKSREHFAERFWQDLGIYHGSLIIEFVGPIHVPRPVACADIVCI